VVLNPLAKVGGGMLMAVIVRGRQFMMHFERRGKGRKHGQYHGHRHGDE
jgi:hypothetical protein